ncbi:MAG: hypothetical protein J7497_01010, partial [Chitinophagaceae bacterium]|nr:hypothetical protein [Chitinophagaceae bacterium]
MKFLLLISAFIIVSASSKCQIDPDLLTRKTIRRDSLSLNMDAIYSRPLLQAGKLPVALGGYLEANYQYLNENGISEGHQFQMRRLTLFVSSTIYKRIKFLTEIEFEDGAKETNIEFASVD